MATARMCASISTAVNSSVAASAESLLRAMLTTVRAVSVAFGRDSRYAGTIVSTSTASPSMGGVERRVRRDVPSCPTELWLTGPHCSKTTPPFWRLVDSSMDGYEYSHIQPGRADAMGVPDPTNRHPATRF